MKKSLILALMLTITAGSAIASTNSTSPATVPTKQVQTAPEAKRHFEGPNGELMPPPPPQFKNKKAEEFEKRLNLTEEQKAKAKAIRQKGHDEMQPLMEKRNQLKQQKEMVKLSKITVEEQEKRIAEIDAQLKELKKQAHELRAKNMKEFETILTDKQKKELDKMKKEGRKNFEKNKKSCEKQTKCDCPMMQPKRPVE